MYYIKANLLIPLSYYRSCGEEEEEDEEGGDEEGGASIHVSCFCSLRHN